PRGRGEEGGRRGQVLRRRHERGKAAEVRVMGSVRGLVPRQCRTLLSALPQRVLTFSFISAGAARCAPAVMAALASSRRCAPRPGCAHRHYELAESPLSRRIPVGYFREVEATKVVARRGHAMKRMHVHVSVDDISRAVGFYSALFDTKPAVLKDDYAKWMLDD